MTHFSDRAYAPRLRGPLGYEHLHRYAAAGALAGGKRVLDLAAGEGYGSALLARTAAAVTGLDIDADAVAHARNTYFDGNLRFVRGDATALPLGDDSIDLVVSFETIEQLDEPERMLDEVRRVLAPGGVLVISSPNWAVYDRTGGAQTYRRRLDHAEFRDLLATRFRSVRVFGQRIIASSVMHPLGGPASDDARWIGPSGEAMRSGLPPLPDPAYFIAVCGDDVAALEFASAYLDPRDDLLAGLRDGIAALRAGNAPEIALPASAAAAAPPHALPPLAAHDAGEGEAAHLRDLLDVTEHDVLRLSEALADALRERDELARGAAAALNAATSPEAAAEHGAALAAISAQAERERAALLAEFGEERDALQTNFAVERREMDEQRAAWSEREAGLERDRIEAEHAAQRLRDELDAAQASLALAQTNAAHVRQQADELAELRAEIAQLCERAAQREDDAATALARDAQQAAEVAALRARLVTATAEEERLRAELLRERVVTADSEHASERIAHEQVARLTRLVDRGAEYALGEPEGHAGNAQLRRELLERAEAAQRDSLALQAVLSSRSWRMTAPMRSVLRLFGRGQ